MTAYYNEHDPGAAAWLRELIAADLIAKGEVDERSIADVRPNDLRGFGQCHFFAGIGGWSLALRSAGVPDHFPIWTGSCPCQPFSAAGKRIGFDDPRHLWPYWRYLIAQCRPAICFGEQVAAASDWLRLVRSDLEALEYAVGAMPVEAASAGADHLRDRFWFVADDGCRRRAGSAERLGNAPADRGEGVGNVEHAARIAQREPHDESNANAACGQTWAISGSAGSYEWVIGADGKARRVESRICSALDGVSYELAGLRAVIAAEAAEKVRAYATSTDRRWPEILQAVWEAFRTGQAQSALGGSRRFCSPEILFNFLFGSASAFQAACYSRRIAQARGTDGQANVRILRQSEFYMRAPSRRESDEQLATQSANSLPALSLILACYAEADEEARRYSYAQAIPLLVNGFPNRMNALRGFGNAIDPRPAAAFIKASIEALTMI